MRTSNRLRSLLVTTAAALGLTIAVTGAGVSPPPAGAAAPAGAVVAEHGRLGTQGASLVGEDGTPVQLRGMSSHGVQWFPQFVNRDTMRWLRDDWGATVFRPAMYTEGGGYIENPGPSEAKVREAVDAAIELGVYVVVDWHILSDGDPNTHRDRAVDFFDRISRDYAGVPNVIYEIANEPNGEQVTWEASIRPYAERVVPVIRANDPQAPVLVGTGTWSQDVDEAAANPLPYDDVLYTVHFYAGSHGQFLRDRIDQARAAGLPVFVTEWGVSEASGNGGVFEAQTREWISFLDERGISWINWNLADKDETSSALRPGASPTGGWGADQLSPSGALVRELMLAP